MNIERLNLEKGLAQAEKTRQVQYDADGQYRDFHTYNFAEVDGWKQKISDFDASLLETDSFTLLDASQDTQIGIALREGLAAGIRAGR